MNDNYRIQHTAPTNDGYHVPLWALDRMVSDVYDRPQDHHGGDDPTILRALAKTVLRSGAIVRIFRSVPAGVKRINPGDWVSLSEQYARDANDDDHVLIWQDVPAEHVWWDGNSLFEYGYDPTPEGFSDE